ncbi:MAG: hypothetical protein INH41_31080 [Myxococcaceae bacterium]|jgi:hypothetical protein|nr:hypothetical protein [Myxococcaceae bacterium]
MKALLPVALLAGCVEQQVAPMKRELYSNAVDDDADGKTDGSGSAAEQGGTW